MKPLNKIKGRLGSLSPAKLEAIAEMSSAAGRLLEVDVPALIKVAELAEAFEKTKPSMQLRCALRELEGGAP